MKTDSEIFFKTKFKINFKVSAVRLFIAAIILQTLFTAASCSGPKDKKFSKAGMSITLTDEFYENEYYNLTAHYEMKDEDVTVSATKEEFTAIEEAGDSIPGSIQEYAALIMEDNDIDAQITVSASGKSYFTFKRTPDETEYVYYAFLFQTDDAFWLFQFGCEASAEKDFKDRFMKWADSINFN